MGAEKAPRKKFAKLPMAFSEEPFQVQINDVVVGKISCNGTVLAYTASCKVAKALEILTTQHVALICAGHWRTLSEYGGADIVTGIENFKISFCLADERGFVVDLTPCASAIDPTHLNESYAHKPFTADRASVQRSIDTAGIDIDAAMVRVYTSLDMYTNTKRIAAYVQNSNCVTEEHLGRARYNSSRSVGEWARLRKEIGIPRIAATARSVYYECLCADGADEPIKIRRNAGRIARDLKVRKNNLRNENADAKLSVLANKKRLREATVSSAKVPRNDENDILHLAALAELAIEREDKGVDKEFDMDAFISEFDADAFETLPPLTGQDEATQSAFAAAVVSAVPVPPPMPLAPRPLSASITVEVFEASEPLAVPISDTIDCGCAVPMPLSERTKSALKKEWSDKISSMTREQKCCSRIGLLFVNQPGLASALCADRPLSLDLYPSQIDSLVVDQVESQSNHFAKLVGGYIDQLYAAKFDLSTMASSRMLKLETQNKLAYEAFVYAVSQFGFTREQTMVSLTKDDPFAQAWMEESAKLADPLFSFDDEDESEFLF